ncbi:hypothetical protein QYF61_027669 [Mycteria americana]|uniref:Rna-directed dna polymerase from mobile element jockey-like n=1 Tax=Mycteria americana TaxID=33587 RepID=A0AAN7NQE2_MYCAM|nr:hypothetical protein QYF61_027669 [Mycteria americana]
MGSKRKGRENVGLLLNGAGDLMAKDMEKAEVPSLPQSLLALVMGEVPEAGKEANVTHIFKKGKKEDPGTYRLVSVTLIPGKIQLETSHWCTPELILGLILFNILNNDLDNETECACSEFADDKRLGGVVDRPDECGAIQRDLNRLEKWADLHLCDQAVFHQAVFQLCLKTG